METVAPLKIAMVAGEPSGDLLAARLVRALKKRYPHVQCFGVGGPKMIEAGFQSWYPIETLSVNGIFEILKHYPSIARMRTQLIHSILAEKPDLFIGIDSPDFNLDLEYTLKAKGIPTMHYISPTIWAWRAERIDKIAKACDHILVLFPFEAPLYEKQDIPATYVGHPLADDIPEMPNTLESRQALGCADAGHVFSLLPGSRNSEVHYHGDLLVQTAKRLYERYPDACFPVPTATKATRALFEAAIVRNCATHMPFLILDGHSTEAIAAADVVVLASGTATLEAALWKKPMVITYRISWLTWQIARRMVRLKRVGLPNILCQQDVVPEYLQDQATPDNLFQAVVHWVEHPEAVQSLVTHFQALHAQLKQCSSETAANSIVQFLEARRPSAEHTV